MSGESTTDVLGNVLKPWFSPVESGEIMAATVPESCEGEKLM